MKLYTEYKRQNTVGEIPIKHIAHCQFNPELGLNTHFRFYFFEKGSGIISINNRNISFVAPCCFCLNENEILGIQKLETYTAHAIYFSPSIINNSFNFNTIRSKTHTFSQADMLDLYWLQTFLERSDSYTGSMLVGPTTAQRIVEICNNVGKELTEQVDTFWPCRSRSYFFELLNLLNTVYSHPLQGEHVSGEEPIHSIIHYLNEHYHQKILITDLTNLFNINRTTLSERFLQATGMSIISYLTKIRIKIACLLLKDTTLPVIEIMYRVGFEDSTHFGRVFKKETSFSPSQYRDNK